MDLTDDQGWTEEILNTPGITQGYFIIHLSYNTPLNNTVIECYQNWCGPCKAITSTFKKLYFDLGDKPLKFYTVIYFLKLNYI